MREWGLEWVEYRCVAGSGRRQGWEGRSVRKTWCGSLRPGRGSVWEWETGGFPGKDHWAGLSLLPLYSWTPSPPPQANCSVSWGSRFSSLGFSILTSRQGSSMDVLWYWE